MNSIHSVVSLKASIKKKVKPDPIDWESYLKDAPPPILPQLFTPEHFSIIDLDALELARQMSIIEFNLFRKIPSKEFLNQKW
jgi:hypothetical protein